LDSARIQTRFLAVIASLTRQHVDEMMIQPVLEGGNPLGKNAHVGIGLELRYFSFQFFSQPGDCIHAPSELPMP
jgi:predicted N-acetyltransferase YhbS